MNKGALIALTVFILFSSAAFAAKNDDVPGENPSGRPFQAIWDEINNNIWGEINNTSNKISEIQSDIEGIRSSISEIQQRIDELWEALRDIELTPGPQGEQGLEGEKGERGDRGEVGPQGPPGEPSNITVFINNQGSDGCVRPEGLMLDIEGVLTSDNLTYISPIKSETVVIGFSSGDDITMRNRPGRTKILSFDVWADIHSSEAEDLFSWRNDVLFGVYPRKSGSITIDDGAGNIVTYDFHGAWPSRLETPFADPCTGKTIESYTVTIESLERN